MSEEQKPTANTIIVRRDGPFVCQGSFTLLNSDGDIIADDNELYLCRCGNSHTLPFCDGTHKKLPFRDEAKFVDDRAEEISDPSAPVTITVKANAMYVVKGPVTIRNEDASSSTTRNRAALCRCGESAKKPFCDVSHKQVGF
ncbi:CDGSH iron-sulfur domain-containing protein, partial [Kaarinaea lacus]